jgi:hypothetical protein
MPPTLAPLVPSIPVTLDRPRTVLFTRLAVKTIEVELSRIWARDYTFFEAVRRLSEMLLDNDLSKLSYVNISVLLWQGCRHEDATLTLETVEEALPYMDPTALIPYAGVILQAWQAGSPTPPPVEDEGEVAETNPLGGSIGAPSGLLSIPASA